MSVTLLTGDGRKFSVPLDLAQTSKTIADLLEDIGGSLTDDVVPLPNVRASTMDQIIAFWTRAMETSPANPWAAIDGFVDELPMTTVCDLIVAANYLDMQPFLDGLCKYIAALIKDKNTEQIREVLEIENDFEPEEEARIRAENAWAFADP